MDNSNDMANMDSAGAIVRHISPFDNLPSHQNNFNLPDGFIAKWAIPYYMEIGKYDNGFIQLIKQEKYNISKAICLALLGDFNWRTRLVGAYFAAVKGYVDLLDIIGMHLLKSDLCCVGHIHALTLAFFNNEKSIYYLNTYLDYYLTKTDLYFDQKWVMEAMLYLDTINGTNNISKHLDNWVALLKKRKSLEKEQALQIMRTIEGVDYVDSVGKYDNILYNANSPFDIETARLSPLYFQEQVNILTDLTN